LQCAKNCKRAIANYAASVEFNRIFLTSANYIKGGAAYKIALSSRSAAPQVQFNYSTGGGVQIVIVLTM